MRGARPEIRTNLIIMLGSVWWNVLRSGGLRVMLVDMFCLGSIYTVNTRQVYLSPDPGTISLMEILPPCPPCLSPSSRCHISNINQFPSFSNFGQLQVSLSLGGVGEG